MKVWIQVTLDLSPTTPTGSFPSFSPLLNEEGPVTLCLSHHSYFWNTDLLSNFTGPQMERNRVQELYFMNYKPEPHLQLI